MMHFLRCFLAAILVFLAAFLTGCGSGAPSEDELDKILERIEEYRLEKYGPPNGEAYRRYFGEYDADSYALQPGGGRRVQPQTPPAEKIEPLFKADASPMMWKDEKGQDLFRGSFIGFIEQERDGFRDYFSKNDALLRKMDEVLAGGRAHLSWKEEKKTGNMLRLNFLPIQIFEKTLRLRGAWAIAEGRPAESVEWFDRGLRLGTAIGAGKALINDLIGSACEAIALGGFQGLAWVDVSPETLRDALNRLNALEKDMMLPSTEDAIRFDAIYCMAARPPEKRFLRGEIVASLLVLASGEIDLSDPLSAPSCAGHRNYYSRFFARMSKSPLRAGQITCGPALFKRIRGTLRDAPDLFRNPVFTAEEMSKMSPVAVLFLTPSFRGANFLEAGTRAAVVRQQYHLTRLAFAARLYQAEKGRDPAVLADLVPEYLPAFPESEFRVAAPAASPAPAVFTPSTPPPSLPPMPISLEPSGFALYALPDSYFWSNELRRYVGQRITMGGPLSIHPEYDPEHGSLSLKLFVEQALTSSFLRTKPSDDLSIVANYYENALKSFRSVVESVERRQSGGSVILNVRLKRPVCPLAVVSPGPSGNTPVNPPIVYDPTNGSRSNGALVTLVGF